MSRFILRGGDEPEYFDTLEEAETVAMEKALEWLEENDEAELDWIEVHELKTLIGFDENYKPVINRLCDDQIEPICPKCGDPSDSFGNCFPCSRKERSQ